MRNCHVCGTLVPGTDFCPRCMKTMQKLDDPKKMSLDERIREIRMWGDILEVPWEQYTKRIDALVGRHVEMKEYQSGCEYLILLAMSEDDRAWRAERNRDDEEWRKQCDADTEEWSKRCTEDAIAWRKKLAEKVRPNGNGYE
jgi:hypothetical protein